MIKTGAIHDQLNHSLYERLKNKGYDYLSKNEEYATRRRGNYYQGEYDVLAIRHANGKTYHHYYEVKSSYNVKSVARASRQFSRALRAHPERNWQFILVTPKVVRRVRFLNPTKKYLNH